MSDLSEIRVRGTEVQYFVVCPRKLWWFTHGVEQEHSEATFGGENVMLGSLLHQNSYRGKEHREALIDDLLRIDFVDGDVVHEVKKSRGAHRAALFQLLYYLYYLKHEKGVETVGVIDYPKLRRRDEVTLTAELEAQLEAILGELQLVRAAAEPPVLEAPMKLCRKCAYVDLCWG